MTTTRRATARLLAILLAVCAVLVAEQTSADAATGSPTAARALVVGVPGLTWADIDPRTTPHLWALASSSPIGSVSVRAVRSTTCLLDGWASLGAGNRVRVPGPDEGIAPIPLPSTSTPAPGGTASPTGSNGTAAPQYNTSLTHCGLQERVATIALSDPVTDVRRAAADPGTRRFGAQPGALGAAVGCATVVGRAAALAAAAPRVHLTRRDALPTDPAELRSLLAGCALSLVSLDQLTDAGQPGAQKTPTGTDPALRAGALRRIDAAVGELQTASAGLPGTTLLLLQGISEVNDGNPRLHVGIASGPGFDTPGWLTSASTGRTPYLELIDVAPTVLQALNLPIPASMNGQAMQVTAGRPPLAEAVAQLDRADIAASVHYRHTGIFFWILVILVGALVLAGVLAVGGWHRGPPAGIRGARARRAVRTAALLVAALPVATYLADLAPWARAAAPGPALFGALVVADLVVAAVAGLGPWRRHRLGPALAVLTITWATLLADVFTGSHLELNGLLGYDAIVAGRFVGYGNLTFGLQAVCALLVTAAVATVLARRARPGRDRLVAGGVTLLIGLVTVGVIGTPSLGRDFGGVLSALPGFLLLAMLLAHLRVTLVRMAAILGAAVVAVGAVAVLDWLRPPSQRSHLGRFVEQILTGEAWTVISRKAQANLDILRGSSLAWMLPVMVLAALWLLLPGGALRSRSGVGPGGLDGRDTAVLRAGLLAVLLSLTLGALVNDSGVAIPATAAALLLPLLVWLAAGHPSEGTGTGETERGSPGSGPADDPDRVTVVSRGSTVWNT